jgi:polysaccharide biosynthesis/export protein
MLMSARTVAGCGRGSVVVAGLLLASLAGCQGLGRTHEARRIPQYGTVDAGQPGELRMVAEAPYELEPPDDLDIRVRPLIPDWHETHNVVQPDGTIHLALAGDVNVYGLTLAEAEERIAAQLNDQARASGLNPSSPYKVSVRLANGQSKYYYVIGTVAAPGRFKATGNETVLDAIMLAGLRTNSLPEKAYLVRPHALGAHDQVYLIDWCGIKDRGDTLTNYQIMPGDRVVVPGTKPPGLISTLLAP